MIGEGYGGELTTAHIEQVAEIIESDEMHAAMLAIADRSQEEHEARFASLFGELVIGIVDDGRALSTTEMVELAIYTECDDVSLTGEREIERIAEMVGGGFDQPEDLIEDETEFEWGEDR